MNDDVTVWITALADGNPQAAEKIWERYRRRLVHLAEKRLGSRHRRAADEEDVVQSAFASFCRAVQGKRFSRLGDRHDLWKLLVTITARKAMAQLRREHAEKRGGGRVRGESVFLANGTTEAGNGIAGVLGNEPSPEMAVQVAEQCDLLLDALGDASLREVALRKLEGFTNAEIARQLDCVEGTVERKLARIRRKWSAEIGR